jgi:hypothetical protein
MFSASINHSTPAAHKMDQLQPVPCTQNGLPPGSPRNNRPIMFYSDAIALKSQFGDKLIKAGRGRKSRKAA